MTSIYPEIRDTSTLTGIFNLPTFMPIGIEGQKATAGTAVVATPYVVDTPALSDSLFGASTLSTLVKFVLARGIPYVVAVASASNVSPTLVQRQAAWTALEENPTVRIRLTDSLVQADHVALADSCEYAELIQHKQWAAVGMATGTTLSGLTTAAAAIASRRAILVGPGIYDQNGNLLNGSFAAAAWACERAKSFDLTDDFDLTDIPATSGVEKDATGMPLFRSRANGGTPLNDFDTLLNGGVSPLALSPGGAARMVHPRTTFTTDTTYDSLNTLLIKDQLFLDIAQLLYDDNVLRRPNNDYWRSFVAASVTEYLARRAAGVDAWIKAPMLPSGSQGFGVTVTSDSTGKQMNIAWQAIIDRGTQKINVNGVLSIAA
jgi:hypothetical protein